LFLSNTKNVFNKKLQAGRKQCPVMNERKPFVRCYKFEKIGVGREKEFER
jgi:hypothetical protein